MSLGVIVLKCCIQHRLWFEGSCACACRLGAGCWNWCCRVGGSAARLLELVLHSDTYVYVTFCGSELPLFLPSGSVAQPQHQVTTPMSMTQPTQSGTTPTLPTAAFDWMADGCFGRRPHPNHPQTCTITILSSSPAISSRLCFHPAVLGSSLS
jgi:hypothetical protein